MIKDSKSDLIIIKNWPILSFVIWFKSPNRHHLSTSTCLNCTLKWLADLVTMTRYGKRRLMSLFTLLRTLAEATYRRSQQLQHRRSDHRRRPTHSSSRSRSSSSEGIYDSEYKGSAKQRDYYSRQLTHRSTGLRSRAIWLTATQLKMVIALCGPSQSQ